MRAVRRHTGGRGGPTERGLGIPSRGSGLFFCIRIIYFAHYDSTQSVYIIWILFMIFVFYVDMSFVFFGFLVLYILYVQYIFRTGLLENHKKKRLQHNSEMHFQITLKS